MFSSELIAKFFRASLLQITSERLLLSILANQMVLNALVGDYPV